MKHKLMVIFALGMLFLLTACDKKNEGITSMKDLKVQEDFTFQTVKPIKITLHSVDISKNIVPLASFSINRDQSKHLLNAKTNENGVFEFTMTVPSYETKLYLIADEQTYTLNIPSNGEIDYTFTGTTSKTKSNYSYFTPAQNQFATLCFEDLWPSNGDYDINDLVLDINVEEVYNQSTWNLTNLIFKYKVRAIGATRTIGFAITLPDYIEATGAPVSSNNSASFVTQHNTLVFFNNARDIVNDIPSEFFNTEHSKPYNSDAEIVHEINLPVTENWDKTKGSKMVWIPWYSAPYNPFIFINNNQSYQIHLKHYPVKTNYANMNYFNTHDDNSDITYPDYPSSYQNYNYCPWAFYIAESMPYPLEKVSILNAFPQFANWALNGGWDYQDWYRNYDNNYIYRPNH